MRRRSGKAITKATRKPRRGGRKLACATCSLATFRPSAGLES